MRHWLHRLLRPESIAIVGASEKQSSLGASTYRLLIDRGYRGEIFPVNPKYPSLFDRTCYPSLSALPQSPDLTVFAISGLALERSFDEGIAMGVGGMLLYANNQIKEETPTPLPQRLGQKARDAGIPVCGGNSMGFYNYDDSVFVSFDRPPPARPRGHIGLIAHSGSAMTYLANNDERFCYNYVIASGQETHGTVADYMDFLVEQPSTRVIALFIEAIRDPAKFVDGLKKARRRNIPVVVAKLGRTEKSARLAVSHSGAMAGDYQGFLAVCERYGVFVANDIDEMITTAMLFASGRRAQSDGLAGLSDSGGMREQMIDLADRYGLRFIDIADRTAKVMKEHLEFGLSPDNPLDAMGALGRNSGTTYLECGKALLDEPDCGLLIFEFEFRDGFTHYPAMFDVIKQLFAYSAKPVIVVNSCAFTKLSDTAASLCQEGIPTINGIDVALRGIRHFCRLGADPPVLAEQPACDGPAPPPWPTEAFHRRYWDESAALKLLSEWSLPAAPHAVVRNFEEALEAARRWDYPIVMKTAEPGIPHKSDCGGVKLAIESDRDLEAAYGDLSAKLGSRALVMPMITDGVEVALGMKNDPQFGPLIMVASGGVLVEVLDDRAFGLAPLDPAQASRMLEALKLSKLLRGPRGRPAADVVALTDLIVEFSKMAFLLADRIAEMDLNPVIVGRSGCTIVDALIIPKPVG